MNSRAATILLVEDEDAIGRCLQSSLEVLGYHPLPAAKTCEQALQRCREPRPDLALVDICLRGGGDGVELAEHLQQDLDVPVIFVTAHCDDATLDRARAVRPHGYLLKPFRTLELRTAIEVALSKHALDARLRRSEANYRSLVESALDPILVMREDRLVYANPAALRVLGYTDPRGLTGRSLTESVVVEPHWTAVTQLIRGVAEGEVPTEPLEVRCRRADGREIWLEKTAVASDFDGRPAVVLMARDVTERRHLRARLALADRMASVGALAGGVAHEVNNPLTYVIGNLDLIAEQLLELPSGEQRDDLVELVEEARQGADRVRRIVRDLRTFSRGGEDVRRPVDVHDVLDSCINMAWNEIRHRAGLVRAYGEVPPVLGDESRLGQVFLNLLINAAQAIPDGDRQANQILVRTVPDGDTVQVEVADTGTGIEPGVAAKLFDPFFTTKEVGVGTGLGLSICHSIVTSMRGQISFSTEPGVGTTFRVVLPVADRDQLPACEPPREPVVEIPRRRGRVLVVDDDRLSGRFVQRALEREHEVVLAFGGRDAIRQVERLRFDVILCDLMMPDMDGIDFYREVDRVAPHVRERILFLTGGAFTPTAREFLREVANDCLEKPLSGDRLRELVRTRVG